MPVSQTELQNALNAYRAGQFAAAEPLFRKALADPAAASVHADVSHFLGLLLARTNRAEEGLGLLRRAIQLAPRNATITGNMGELLRRMGRPAEAESYLRRAVDIGSDPIAMTNLGSMLVEVGRHSEAEQWFAKALAANPDHITARANWALSLKQQGHHAEARPMWEELCKKGDRNGDVWFELGLCLRGLLEFDLAADAFAKSAEFLPTSDGAWMNLASMLSEVGDSAGSLIAADRAIALRPDVPFVHLNARATCASIPIERDELRRRHFAWGMNPALTLIEFKYPNSPDPDRRLKVGLLSPDFRKHAAAQFMWPLFGFFDRSQIETFAYFTSRFADDLTERFRGQADQWRSASGWSPEQLRNRILEDRIDILIDLAGSTVGGSFPVLAARAAPVQMTYLGYPGTTGLKTVDWRITDAICDPPGVTEDLHTEKLLRLDGPFACFAPVHEAPDVSNLPAMTNGFNTFGSTHKLARLNDAVLAAWAQILQRVPTCRLLIHRDNLRGRALEFLRDRLQEAGADLSRIDFSHEAPPGPNHLSIYNRIDMLLDTFPWSGHTTACEAMWMGLPTITLRGDTPSHNLVSSVVHYIGRPEWSAENVEAYASAAAKLAANADELATIRAGLRNQMKSSPVCDASATARALQQTIRKAWHEWCNSTAGIT